MRIFGLHVNEQLQTGRDHLDTTLTALGADTTVLVLNETKLALELSLRGYDVIYRATFEGDDQYRGFDVEAFWARVGAVAEAGIPVQWLNEPIVASAADQAEFFDAYQRVSRARPTNARLVVGNFSVGNPHEGRMSSGAFDDFLRDIITNYDILGLHEYAPVLEDTDDVKINPWYIGRFKFWIDRCDAIKLPRPRVILSEFGYDRGGGHGDGWNGNISAEDYAALLRRHAALLRAFHVSALVFGWGDGFSWQSFNIERAQPVIDALTAENAVPLPPVVVTPPPTAPLPQWEQRIFEAVPGGANMRASAHKDAAIMQTITAGKFVADYDPAADKPDADTPAFIWRKLRYRGIVGYVRSDAASFYVAPPAPTPEPTPTPLPNMDTTPVCFTVEELKAISSSLQAIGDQIATIRAVLIIASGRAKAAA